VTVLLQTPERNVNPNQPLDGSVTLAQDIRELRVTCTVVNWPLGPVGSITLTRPDGSFGGSCTFSGDPATDRAGNPLLTRSGGWEMPNRALLPHGLWVVDVEVFQQVRTAVTVEGF
jgi:hypothetical protein